MTDMRLARLREHAYIRSKLCEVRHITLDPKGPGVIRVHMVPPSSTWDRSVPFLLILNGMSILPVGMSWAILLDCFIRRAEPYHGLPIREEDWHGIMTDAVRDCAAVYPSMQKSDIRRELEKLLQTLTAAAKGKPLPGKLRAVSFAEYARHMKAPHRMDLMVSAMEKNGCWNCNQKCLHCYAAGQSGAGTAELTTAEWYRIIDACRRAGIPQLTFTGGEPTMRDDLVKLIDHAQWFVTRLNTNGLRLTPALCAQLYEAGLDAVQITLYSHHSDIHNRLVGADGFDRTVAGIQNALAAGLNVSVNTPLCSLNQAYDKTLAFLHKLGVRYVTCSGLIPSGNALTDDSAATALTEAEMDRLLTFACAYARNDMELSFTSPGWLTPERLTALGLTEVPACGACLSNMAVRPDGQVIPCQSWLSGEGLGNMLNTPFSRIWRSHTCTRIREISADTYYACQLRAGNREGGGLS